MQTVQTVLAYLSIQHSQMLRELLHIDQIKSLAEGTFNCWLSYTMSQPVQFDLAILAPRPLEAGTAAQEQRRTQRAAQKKQAI